MKPILITVVMAQILTGCADLESRHGLHRLSDPIDAAVDTANREVQVLLKQMSEGNHQGDDAVLEVMHPDLRLFNKPISESNRRRVRELRERLEARRGDLEFAITRRYFFDVYEVVEVIVADGGGVPTLWYFMRNEKGGKLWLREAPGLEVGPQFKMFALTLPVDELEKAELSNAMAVAREERLAREEASNQQGRVP